MKRFILSVALLALFTAACDEATTDPTAEATDGVAFKTVARVPLDQSPIAMDMSEWVVELDGGTAAVAYFEYITAGDDGEQVGRTVFASDRGNKQLTADWVPGDPLREGRTDINYAVDGTEGATSSGLTEGQTTAAIQRGMETWDGMNCSNIPITNLGVAPFDLGYVQWLLGYGGVPGYVADLTHAGWLPGAFFDDIAPGGSGFILGVTFTFIWIDGGVPTDMDNNGKDDVAFREIYYNDAFTWNIDSTYDVETIAFHEAGHGLSQGHFGDIFRTDSNGKFHFAPRAVMNAAYSGVQQSPTGTDNGGHCSIWGSWPNN